MYSGGIDSSIHKASQSRCCQLLLQSPNTINPNYRLLHKTTQPHWPSLAFSPRVQSATIVYSNKISASRAWIMSTLPLNSGVGTTILTYNKHPSIPRRANNSFSPPLLTLISNAVQKCGEIQLGMSVRFGRAGLLKFSRSSGRTKIISG
jgi:hypothetical protein